VQEGTFRGWAAPDQPNCPVDPGLGLVASIGLVTRFARRAWLLAFGVAAGPLLGYVLSRGPGLPNYLDDRGNWDEPLGLISLAVECALLVLAIAVLVRNREAKPLRLRPRPDHVGHIARRWVSS
jgi:hypothetical protein